MLKNIAPKARGRAVPKARRLRRSMSLPEVILWRELPTRPEGLKFRRQHASGAFVLDFFCNDARMAIEIHGEAHARGDRPVRDQVRDAWFAAAGIATLRIPAAEVLDNLEGVLRHILEKARRRLPLHHPALLDGPPPRDELGEE